MALKRREQQLISLAGLVAFCVLGYLYVVEPLRTRIATDQERIPVREKILAKARQTIAQKELLRRELEELSHTIDEAKTKLLPGSTPALAASELQTRVKGFSADTGVEVRSERVLPTVERGELLEVPLEITVSSGIRELASLLDRLQSADNLLTLSDVKVRVVSIGQPKELLTTLTISGYILSPSQPPKSGDKITAPSKG
ncbi:MAG TPA: type II secretion system protein GspM [Methylomirabilota bacterium]|nr:type II secretion system protein GspM [Methylomirabilota bacterium]